MVYRGIVLGMLMALLGMLSLHHMASQAALGASCPYGDPHPPPSCTQRPSVESTLINQNASIVDIRRDTLRDLLDRPFELWTALGIGGGDRIVSVNGVRHHNCLSALPFSMAAEASDGPSVLDLEIERGGERVRTVVIVHDPR